MRAATTSSTATKTDAKPTTGWDRDAASEVRDRFDELQTAQVTPLVVSSFKINGVKVFSIESGHNASAAIEVFAENGQLVRAHQPLLELEPI